MLVILYNMGMYINSFIYERASYYFIPTVILLIGIYLVWDNNSVLVMSKNLNDILIAMIILFIIIAINYVCTKTVEGIFMLSIYMLVLGELIEAKLNHATVKIVFIVFMSIYLGWIFRIENYFDYFMTQLYIYKVNSVLNSNTVGQVIAILTMILYAIMCHFGVHKIYGYIILLGGIWGCINCQTRASTGALIFFCGLVIFMRKIFKREQLKKYLLRIYTTIYWGGVLFPVILVYIFKNKPAILGQDILGKGVYSGREKLWSELFDYIAGNKIRLLIGFGHYSKFEYLADNASDIHSWFLRVLFLYGISGLVIFFMLYYSLLKRACNRSMTESRFVFIVAFISIFIICYFEISLGYFSLAMLCHFPLALACNKYFDKDNRRKIYYIRFNKYKKILGRSCK